MRLSQQDEEDLRAWAESWTPLPAVADMLLASVGRIGARNALLVRKKMSARGMHIPIFGAMPDDDDIHHIVDWLTMDHMAGAAWIDRVDTLGRPLKLMKCGDISRLLHEANKAMRKRLQGLYGKVGEGDEVTVAELAGGYSVVRLMTKRALDVESRRMGHCVGMGAYDETVERGTTEIYSLRDPEDWPLVTIEVSLDNLEWSGADGDFRTRPLEGSGRTVDQIQGLGNTKPAAEHMDVLEGFLARSGWGGWEDWYRPEDPAMEGVREAWEGLRRRDLTRFVDHLLARADNEERDDGIQPTR